MDMVILSAVCGWPGNYCQVVCYCDEYTYLGVIFYVTGNYAREIKRIVFQTKKAIEWCNGIWGSKEIRKKRKHSIYDAIVKCNLLYGTETWHTKEQNKKILEAVEMDVLKRSLWISRTDKVPN